mmetsp:Transcript_6597/g.11911  ORF Transcript_6597/g.11911 Transcript_6597/m.11911 type:complete len:84 (-) Transcript_6597:226-477(-)
MDPHAAISLALAFLCSTPLVAGLEVYLTELTIYDTHDLVVKPDVYFKCKDDRRIQMLTDVKEAVRMPVLNAVIEWLGGTGRER